MKITNGQKHSHEVGEGIIIGPGETVEVKDPKKQESLLCDSYFNALRDKGLIAVSIGPQEDHFKAAKSQAIKAKKERLSVKDEMKPASYDSSKSSKK